jgi:histidinol-phosphate aminotransferase
MLRTLSKAWGLAGTRCGAVVAAAPIIALLRRMLPPYAFSEPATERILRSLSGQGRKNARALVAETLIERDRMQQALQALPCVAKVWPSDSNFLLVRFDELERVQRQLNDKGILIRAFEDSDLLANCARITIGENSENDTLLAALAGMPEVRA